MDFSVRSRRSEWMDTETISDADFARCLADLATVNTVTLTRPPTVAFLRRVARRLPPGTGLSVLDVGFGHGDMLRRLARWGRRRGLPIDLAGVDLNPASAAAARAATPPGMAITYRTGDVFDEPPGSVDIVISSQFTHHLSDPDVVRFLSWMEATARRGWFISDLHRHPLAYYGFTALSLAAGWHRFVQHDGPISVARSFRRRDWTRLLQQAGLDQVAEISWHVPFRLCVSRVR
ncbi:MAG: class I SAM-dependent methyltransferase [Acetobacteraceae bacterium]